MGVGWGRGTNINSKHICEIAGEIIMRSHIRTFSPVRIYMEIIRMSSLTRTLGDHCPNFSQYILSGERRLRRHGRHGRYRRWRKVFTMHHYKHALEHIHSTVNLFNSNRKLAPPCSIHRNERSQSVVSQAKRNCRSALYGLSRLFSVLLSIH